MENEMNEYDEQAVDFLSKTDSELLIKFVKKGRHFDDDEKDRDIYEITLTRGDKEYRFMFGQSYVDSRIGFSEVPSAYDVLTCLQKYNPGSFEDFCDDFGYDEDSRRAEKVYEAVKKEYVALSALYSEAELELLRGV